MKISIVTTTKNETESLRRTIDSVRKQDYWNLEYIICDRGSSEATLDIIRDNSDVIDKWQSEPDKGLFEGLNSGVRLSSGGVVGTLAPGSVFYDENVLSNIAEKIDSTRSDACWGDLIYIDKDDSSKIKKFWKSSPFEPGKFEVGWMPPHETFFVKRKFFEECGFYKPELGDLAYYELMLRFLKLCNANTRYLSQPVVKARLERSFDPGKFIQNQRKCYRAWKINGLDGGLLAPFLGPFYKLLKNLHRYDGEK